MLRIEPEKEDQAPSAILQLVDGPRDLRFMMVAKTIAREREHGLQRTDITTTNLKKITAFRPNAEKSLEEAVEQMRIREIDPERMKQGTAKKRVYRPRKDHK